MYALLSQITLLRVYFGLFIKCCPSEVEVEEAVQRLEAGKSPRVDNSLSEFLKNRGEATTALTVKW